VGALRTHEFGHERSIAKVRYGAAGSDHGDEAPVEPTGLDIARGQHGARILRVTAAGRLARRPIRISLRNGCERENSSAALPSVRGAPGVN
jgi:hypothetical protein